MDQRESADSLGEARPRVNGRDVAINHDLSRDDSGLTRVQHTEVPVPLEKMGLV
jgi:hypothetical protein